MTRTAGETGAVGMSEANAPKTSPARDEGELWAIGSWLSAALDDPKVCPEMKADINEWFDGGGHLRAALSPAQTGGTAVAWACKTCNSPRAVDPCPKCGTALTKPADGWTWPRLPDIARIRELAREVGYAVGVHGTLERDLDLIAAPWVADAVGPLELAQHIAAGLGGEVVDYANQDKACGRWSCNIHTPDWTKMIDLSVMPPAVPVAEGAREDSGSLQPQDAACVPSQLDPPAVASRTHQTLGPFDAPPYCPVCGRAGSHLHGPDAIAQHRERASK